MYAERVCRRQWIGSSVLRMLEILSHDRHPEVEGDDITVVVAAAERNKQRDGECAVMHHVCAITMLITNVEGRSFILLFVRNLPQTLVLLLLLVVKTSTGSGPV